MSKSILDMYQVKVTQKTDPEHILFGRVDRYHDEVDAMWKDKKIIITEPVYQQQYIIDLRHFDVEDQPFTWGEMDEETRMPTGSEFDRYIFKEYKEHVKRSDDAGAGIKKHKMFTVGVADGCAHYVVTSAGKKNVKIEWRGFAPDNYFDMTLGGGGSFPRHCIEPHIRYTEGMDKLFGKKATA